VQHISKVPVTMCRCNSTQQYCIGVYLNQLLVQALLPLPLWPFLLLQLQHSRWGEPQQLHANLLQTNKLLQPPHNGPCAAAAHFSNSIRLGSPF
jgi:hypothetical protein